VLLVDLIPLPSIFFRYNIETTRRHNHENWDLQLKLDLKNVAMKALSPEQRAWALDVILNACTYVNSKINYLDILLTNKHMFHFSILFQQQVQTEDCAFPLDFRQPTVTPPIKGFDPDMYAKDS
jgi:hypothetical protein